MNWVQQTDMQNVFDVEENQQYNSNELDHESIELNIKETREDWTDYYIKQELKIWTICPPILLTMGTAGNILSGKESYCNLSLLSVCPPRLFMLF